MIVVAVVVAVIVIIMIIIIIILIVIPFSTPSQVGLRPPPIYRHRLNGYFAQRVPSLFLAISFTVGLNCEALKGMFPWTTR